MTEDNWKNRSKDMRCATCMWFVSKTPDRPSLVTEVTKEQLEDNLRAVDVKLTQEEMTLIDKLSE